jgi:hypothetical protein
MWKQQVHKFLENNQIIFEENTSFSSFETLFLPQSQLYLHLIDLQDFKENAPSITYFQDLSEKINERNQRIIHLWEDVWNDKMDLVVARILAMMGKFNRLNARHCFVERIDKIVANDFLESNHLQGSVKAKFKYGLYLKPQYSEKFLGDSSLQASLIAVATFSGGRTMKEGNRTGTRSYELVRFASLKGYVVVGGMDKLLKAFTEEHRPDDIMSYADRDWSDGRSYDKLGFTKIENISPQLFSVNTQIFKRFRLDHSSENVRTFNAGSIKYIKFLDKYLT